MPGMDRNKRLPAAKDSWKPYHTRPKPRLARPLATQDLAQHGQKRYFPSAPRPPIASFRAGGFRPLLGHALLLLCLLLLTAHADAGEIEPRAYGNTPVGVNFLLAGYAHSEGGLSTAASSPLKDAELRIDTGVLAYARSLDLWGKPAKFDVILSLSDLSGKAMVGGRQGKRTISGLGDPRFRFSIIFFGAPVLSVQEFADYQQDLLIGASVQVSAPLGQYDPDKLVNLGNNRWSVKPDLGISKAWGDVTLELSSGLIFFTDNDDYFGAKELEQDPVSTTQLHAMYTFGRGIWASLSGTYDYGGRTRINGVKSDDLQNNWRAGVTIGLPVNRNNSIKLYASSGVSTRTGSDYDLIGCVWQFRWGSGL
jgi:hypothetical protein